MEDVKGGRTQLIITDLQMPTTGLELLGRIAKEGMETTVIVVTAFGTIEDRGGSDEDGRVRLRDQANRFRSARAHRASCHGAAEPD